MMETGRQQKAGGGFLPEIAGIALLLFGASGVFGELQDTLNSIWGVQPKQCRGVIGIIKDRFLSLAMVLGIAFLLLISLVLSAAVTAIGGCDCRIVRDRQICQWALSREGLDRLRLWRSRFGYHHDRVDLLLSPDSVSRRRVHTGLC
jgi:hypothetical protein